MTIFHLLLLVFVYSTEITMSSGTGQYDELLLALQWPTSYCNTGENKCDHYPIPPRFTVHGLWHNKNSKCVACIPDNRILFDKHISLNLKKNMVARWPNLQSRKHPEYLWIHEFRYHGYCFAEFHSQEVYFGTALQIANAIGPVMGMRLSSGKTLTRGQFYSVEDFKHVTIAGTTLTPGLRCNNEFQKIYPQLLEIVFCTDSSKTLKSCTPNVSNCGKAWKASPMLQSRRDFYFP